MKMKKKLKRRRIKFILSLVVLAAFIFCLIPAIEFLKDQSLENFIAFKVRLFSVGAPALILAFWALTTKKLKYKS